MSSFYIECNKQLSIQKNVYWYLVIYKSKCIFIISYISRNEMLHDMRVSKKSQSKMVSVYILPTSSILFLRDILSPCWSLWRAGSLGWLFDSTEGDFARREAGLDMYFFSRVDSAVACPSTKTPWHSWRFVGLACVCNQSCCNCCNQRSFSDPLQIDHRIPSLFSSKTCPPIPETTVFGTM